MLLKKDGKWFGDSASKNVFLQLVDEHDLALMDCEAEAVRTLTGCSDWCIHAVPVSDWNQDLTPWCADPIFGRQGFGDGAPRTLQRLLEIVGDENNCRCFLCGYSLAGLFALWAGCQTDAFAGITAASPSVWYPGWVAYAQMHPMRSSAVYLSLGEKEEKTRNHIMASVGTAVRRQHELLSAAGVKTTLEWNPGNHFVDSDRRMAKGIAWMLKEMEGANP